MKNVCPFAFTAIFLMSLIVLYPSVYALSTSQWDYNPLNSPSGNYTINVNNTIYHQGLTPQEVANLAPFNSTQFDSVGYINMSWLQSVIETLAPSPDLSAYALISNLVSLLGNWSADKINYYNTTQIDNKISPTTAGLNIFNSSEDIDKYNLDIYETDFCTTANILYTTGTISKSNIAKCSQYMDAGATAGNDARMVFIGTGGGTGTSTSAGFNSPTLLRKVYLKGRWNKDNGCDVKWIFGSSKTSVAGNLDTKTHSLGFWYNSSDAILGQNFWGHSCNNAGSCTYTQSGFAITKNQQYELLMLGNQEPTRNVGSTNYSFYAKTSNDATWTYLGYVNATIAGEGADFGIWIENINCTSANTRTNYDKIYVQLNSDYYTY